MTCFKHILFASSFLETIELPLLQNIVVNLGNHLRDFIDNAILLQNENQTGLNTEAHNTVEPPPTHRHLMAGTRA